MTIQAASKVLYCYRSNENFFINSIAMNSHENLSRDRWIAQYRALQFELTRT